VAMDDFGTNFGSFVLFQAAFGFIILDAFMDLFIIICILLNTLCMALDHYDMNPKMAEVLSTCNYVIYLLEIWQKFELF
jgi:hypothetical protein